MSKARSRVGLKSVVFLFFGLTAFPVRSQITPDATLPNNSIVLPNGSIFTIEGGTPAGTNLFHSFEEFSIPTGGEAFFNQAQSIDNIITRITGGNLSNIDGLIRANGMANLFLINPNGIVLGANARLDLGGSFLGSTAERVLFADGSFYSATDTSGVRTGESPLLSVNVPIGLQMGSNSGNIHIQGNNQNLGSDFVNLNPMGDGDIASVEVQLGQTLAFVGGNIAIEGANLIAPEGRIELGSVAANESVAFSPLPQGWTLDYSRADAFQDISLTQATLVDVSGNAGGSIQLQGRQILASEGSTLSARNQGSGRGESLVIRASDLVEIIGGQNASRISVSVAPEATGQGGDLFIETDRLRLLDGAQLGAGTLGAGDAGNLTVVAASVEVLGTDATGEFPSGMFATVQAIGTGNGGNITVEADNLRVTDEGRITAFSLNTGRAGDITIQADKIDIGDTSDISAFSTQNAAAGSIRIVTDRLNVRDRAEITVSARGLGAAGNLNLEADSIFLDTGASLNADLRAGTQGNITLNTADLRLRRGSSITTNATETATGGNINIETETLLALENSDISANAEQSFGGQVSIAAEGIFGTQFRAAPTRESDITATSTLGTEFSGIVQIQTPIVDPASGLVALATDPLNPNTQVQNSCDIATRSRFAIIGNGGLPPDPTESFQNPRVWRDTRLGEIDTTHIDRPKVELTPNSGETISMYAPPHPLVEATGWTRREDGTVELVARSGSIHSPWYSSPDCQTLTESH